MQDFARKKNFVNVSYKQHEQKCLILCNLLELYIYSTSFAQKCPQIKSVFSLFSSLQPKQCVTVGATGTQSICVCAIHPNAALILEALDIGINIHELTDLMVCNRKNKNCMLHSAILAQF